MPLMTNEINKIIATSLYAFALRLHAENVYNLRQNAVVQLTKHSFATELEKRPHFVMFTFPTSHS